MKLYSTGDIVVIKGDPTQLYLVWSDFNLNTYSNNKPVLLVKFPQTRDHSDWDYSVPYRVLRLATRAEVLLYS